jgi:subtilisin
MKLVLMRPRLVIVSALALLLAALVTSPARATEPASGYIVSLRGAPGSASAIAASHARMFGTRVEHVYSHALNGYSARFTPTQVEELRHDPRVIGVTADRGNAFHVTGERMPTGIDRVDGERSRTVSGDGSGAVDADVAILDTGIDAHHPDLNVVGGVDCTGHHSYQDANGHGTHVAGIAAAKDDDIGVVGVAPGARLWAVRVLDSKGEGSDSEVLCGVDWVTARASTIEVANMSLGDDGRRPRGSGCHTDDELHDGICRSVAAGVPYTVAAGNDGRNARTSVPANYGEVITVSALADFNGKPGGGARPTCERNVDDSIADFSDYGKDVDIIAPGVCILSTWPHGRYATEGGTSMAAPHVAGAIALYKSAHHSASPAAVKSALRKAGSMNWNARSDRDHIKEPLLNVAAF